MAHSFVSRADGLFMCTLEPEERHVIAQIASEVSELIRADLELDFSAGESGESDPDSAVLDDPLARLEAETKNSRALQEPRDAATKRLFPAASADAGEAEEFRRLSQPALAEHHLAALSAIRMNLDIFESFDDASQQSEIVIDQAEALLWLKGLNLIRLVLGERMGIHSDGDFEALQLLCDNDLEEDVTADDTEAGIAFLASIYEFLSWLQESLLRTLSSRS